MFLDSITLVKTIPCKAEPGKIIVFGRPSRLLTEVIPYLATLPDVIVYNPVTCTVTFRRPHGFMTLSADNIYITKVRDVEEGLELFKVLTDAVNAIWAHRSELIAVTTARSAPRLLNIWILLPQTNCKQCGEATCMAFAAALLQHNRSVLECPLLIEDSSFGDRKAVLEAML
jgi:ArsR family metal-binding transcriptional regulator